ncbi:hypothetical protein QBC34DRAFT_281530, partial [Podospora aff. communis PSN243]
LQSDISSMEERCQKSQESLRAEMSLFESKRGIEEAESVARQTELAFIFIPMTFVAGLFSMQVREVADNPPPVYAFVIVALVAVAISYGVRIAQRSVTLARYLRQWDAEIRDQTQFTNKVLP